MARKNMNNPSIYSDIPDATEPIDATIPLDASFPASAPTATVTNVEDDEGWAKTIPVDSGVTEIAGNLNVNGDSITPTVGWVICIKGCCKGQDFRLHTGWNYIGRSSENEICIPDPQVGKVNMCKIAYDNRGRSFVVAPGESTRNLTYIGNTPLLMPQKIDAYDVITVGDTELMFVPLCGEHFAWEE